MTAKQVRIKKAQNRENGQGGKRDRKTQPLNFHDWDDKPSRGLALSTAPDAVQQRRHCHMPPARLRSVTDGSCGSIKKTLAIADTVAGSIPAARSPLTVSICQRAFPNSLASFTLKLSSVPAPDSGNCATISASFDTGIVGSGMAVFNFELQLLTYGPNYLTSLYEPETPTHGEP